MKSIKKILFFLGQKWRNPSLTKIYNELKKSETYSQKKLQDIQLDKLKNIIQFAYDNSNYYNRVFNEVGFNPKKLKSIDDLKKIPLLEKKDLLKYNDKIHTVDNVKFNRLFRASTSGSTGESLTFAKDEYADSFNRASVQRGYSWYGVNVWDYNGYFWGFNFSSLKKIKIRFFDLLMNRYRLFSYDTKELNFFVKKIQKATYIEGYSSMIYETAKIINQNKMLRPQNIRMVKGTSEKILNSYQNEVQKAFGIKMINEYGAAETGIIAFECKSGNMHINTEGVIVEVIGREIVVTNLVMKSFPIIRYKLGDYIELDKSEKQCKCGMKHPVIKEVTGRIGQNIYGNKNIYPSLTFYYIFKNLDKNNNLLLTYQVVQNTKGKLDFYIAENLTQIEKQFLINEILKYFSDDINYRIFDKHNFIIERNKKFISFISNVDK